MDVLDLWEQPGKTHSEILKRKHRKRVALKERTDELTVEAGFVARASFIILNLGALQIPSDGTVLQASLIIIQYGASVSLRRHQA